MAEHPQRLLVVGPSWVGDMVMAQTLFMRLKQQNPEAEIDVLAPEWCRALLERMPEVHKAIPMPIEHGVLGLRQRREIGLALRQERYDQAIVLPNSFKSALIPVWAKIPKRTGWRGEMRWGVLNDLRVLDEQQYPLMIEQFMALAQAPNTPLPKPYPRPQLTVNEESVIAARKRLHLTTWHLDILALCPGAEFGPAKRWPDAYYAEIANAWLDRGGQVWLFGSKNDALICQHIQVQTHQRCENLAGKTTLAEAVDLLSAASAVVTNDSGLMHIAAALNKPLVAVYGSSDPAFTPPLSSTVEIVRSGLSCSPCFKRVCPLQHHECLTKLYPARVKQALTKLLPAWETA